jgi:phage/plasmid-like protein (TIGR03299 family)
MADMVETMFSNREMPWHRNSTIVQGALTSEEALIASGLNWNVVQTPLEAKWNNEYIDISGYVANIRDTDKSVLGVVTESYKVVQNKHAFAFVDNLVGDANLKYETAGSLSGGKIVWMLALLPEIEIAGDAIAPYLVFTNGHDGRNAIKAAMTPVRVVCANTLALALGTSQRQWSTKHIGDMDGKLINARMTLKLAQQYMLNLEGVGNKLVKEKGVDASYMINLSSVLFPHDENASDLINARQNEKRDDILYRWALAPDLEQIRDTKWGALQAVSDSVTHTPPQNQTDTMWETAFSNLVFGNNTIDKAYEYVLRI